MGQIVMNKISNRLKEIINLCKKEKVYADIGCDHGYVTLELLKQQKAQTVYAIDIHKDSLLKTKKLLEQNQLDDKAVFLVSDGFKEIPSKQTINCAVIAGMGGQEIIKILSYYAPKKLILQPMKNSYELRKYLINNNYFIEKDFIFEEKNKFYDIISCRKTKLKSSKLSDLELNFGKDNFKNNKSFIKFLNREKEKYHIIYSKYKSAKTQNILQNIENALNLMQGDNK